MRKTLLISLTSLLTLAASADYTAPGYYRVENYKTKRYVSVIDNRGHIDLANTTADLQAIQLQRDFNEVCCDPASILYVTPKGGNQYQIDAQGTGIHQIIQHYVKLTESGSSNGQKLYRAYGELNGVVKYLGDSEFFPTDLGVMATNASGDYIKWFILPIAANSDNWFGVRPTVSVGGKYYATMYGSFSYSSYSSGIKSYYVKTIDNGIVVIDEITGTVPSNTPVLIECSSSEAKNNRLNIGGSASPINGNKLKGVYFCNHLTSHLNRVAYDKNTMRVLGTCSDGRLGFVTSNSLEYIPKNTAYITVAAGSPAQLPVMTQSEYDNYIKTIPTAVSVTPSTLTLTEGDSSTLSATISPATASGAALTWTTSNSGVATVSNGVVKAVAPGSATITVSTSNGKSAKCEVTVNKCIVAVTGVSISPASLTLVEGDSGTLTATVLPADATDKSVTWSTANSAVATVSNGVVKAVTPGSTTINVTTSNGKSATCEITVNKRIVAATGISLAPTSLILTEGESGTLIATVLPADATDKSVTWSSGNSAIATVSNGTVKAVSPGTVTVKATTSNGLSATCEVTVNRRYIAPASITVEPTTLTLLKGEGRTLTATVLPADADDKSVTWSSSDVNIIKVNGNGEISAVGAGTATITASTVNGIKATCNVTSIEPYPTAITLSVSEVSRPCGWTFTVIATLTPANCADKTLTWSSADPSIADVDGNGLISFKQPGQTIVTATTAGGLSATCNVNVEHIYPESISITPASVELKEGEDIALSIHIMPVTTTINTIEWSVSDTNIVDVSAEGVIHAKAVGQTIVTGRTVNGLEASVIVNVKREVIPVESVTISPSTLELKKIGEEEDLTVEILPQNATDKTLTWTSSNIFVASVDGGHVKALSLGSCTITATAPSGAFSVCEVEVDDGSGIDGIFADGIKANVYDLNGRIVIADADIESLRTLAPGIYAVNGRKLVVK